MSNVDYSARAFWAKAIVINAHIQVGPDLSSGAIDHLCDLLSELEAITGPEYIQERAKVYASAANDRLGRALHPVTNHG